MRPICLITSLALIVATLGVPSAQYCHAALTAATLSVDSCCTDGPCQCDDDCACIRPLPPDSGRQAVLLPAAASVLSLFAIAPVAAAPPSVDAHAPTGSLVSDEVRALADEHASRLTNRAPPLS